MANIVTLLTDFGLADEYVGVMKGVILSRAPAARIVDLSHGVGQYNILQAALILKLSYAYFPEGTVHLSVVDPGVGSGRRIVLLQADGHLFLAPDNGVLSLVLEEDGFQAAYEVQSDRFYLSPVSKTFHGRDIFAPVAAQLANGLAPSEIGPKISRGSLVELVAAKPAIDPIKGVVTGQVISVDRFGNLLTNISEKNLVELAADQYRKVKITLKGKSIIRIAKAYAQVSPGELLAVIGSRGLLEISLNQGDAAGFLEAGTGESVVIEISRREADSYL